jgi:hypothetical protein
MTFLRTLVGLATATALGALAPAARAVERQHHLGLGPTLGMLKVDDKPTLSVGVGATLHYAYGLNDQFNLMAELGSVVVAAEEKLNTPDTPRTRPTRADQASVGLGYVIDILTWVPYLTAQVGAHHLSGGTLASSLVIPSAQLGVGVDYQLSRTFAVGVAARQHFLLTKMSDYPTYTTATLRLEYMWGF